MFCGECGTKNEKGAKFCENCGNPMEEAKEEQVVEEPVVVKQVVEKVETKKVVKKKNKKKILGILIPIIVLVVGLVGTFFVLKGMTDPAKLAKSYFDAVVNYDTDKLYEFIELEKSPFTTKEMFKKSVETEDRDFKIVNYKITEKKLSDDGLSMKVTFSYTEEGKTESGKVVLTLVKTNKKKFLFFDTWKISNNIVDTVKERELKVMKGSTVTIEGVALDSQYINKGSSTDTYDVYTLPAMLGMDYSIKVKLPMGIELEDELNITNYTKSYEVELTLDEITDDMKTKIKEESKTALKNIYDGIINNKTFADIKSNFEFTNADLKTLESSYNKLLTSFSTSSNKLTAIDFTEVDIKSLDLEKDGSMKFYMKLNYNYSISYEDYDGSAQTKDSKNYQYSYLYFKYIDGKFHLVNASSLPDYFSRYF